MKSSIPTLAVLAMLVSARAEVAAVSDTFSYRYAVSGIDAIEVTTLRGNIEVETTGDTVILVTLVSKSLSDDPDVARKRLAAFEYTRAVENGVLDICCDVPVGDSGAIDVLLSLPHGLPLELACGHGSVSATGTRGPIDITTVRGDINVRDHCGPQTAAAAVGEVNAWVDSIGEGDVLHIESIQGDIYLNVLPGILADFRAETFSGSVSIHGLRFESEEWTDRRVAVELGTGLLGLGRATITIENVTGRISVYGRG